MCLTFLHWVIFPTSSSWISSSVSLEKKCFHWFFCVLFHVQEWLCFCHQKIIAALNNSQNAVHDFPTAKAVFWFWKHLSAKIYPCPFLALALSEWAQNVTLSWFIVPCLQCKNSCIWRSVRDSDWGGSDNDDWPGFVSAAPASWLLLAGTRLIRSGVFRMYILSIARQSPHALCTYVVLVWRMCGFELSGDNRTGARRETSQSVTLVCSTNLESLHNTNEALN